MAGRSFEEKIAHVLAYKRHNTYPEGMNRTQRRNLRQFSDHFSLEEGTLFYCAEGRKVTVVRSVNQALDLFEEHHVSPEGAHQGAANTNLSLASKYYWPSMTKDIITWVKQCPQCQKVGEASNLEAFLKSIKVNQHLDLVGMHLIGPLPVTKKGYRYILTATDYISRWVEVFPLQTKSPSELGKKIYDFLLRYVSVSQLLTDRSPEFNNESNVSLCKAWGVERIFTRPPHPLNNDFARSSSKFIQRALQKITEATGRPWDQCLNPILYYLRFHAHPATQMTPYRLLYGFDPWHEEQAGRSEKPPESEERVIGRKPNRHFYQEYMRQRTLRRAADVALALKNVAEAHKQQQLRRARRAERGETSPRPPPPATREPEAGAADLSEDEWEAGEEMAALPFFSRFFHCPLNESE